MVSRDSLLSTVFYPLFLSNSFIPNSVRAQGENKLFCFLWNTNECSSVENVAHLCPAFSLVLRVLQWAEQVFCVVPALAIH